MSSATMTNWCLCSKRFDGDRTEEHPRSAAAPFGPQMARQHQRRHPQPVRADVGNLMEREMHRAPPTVAREQAATEQIVRPFGSVAQPKRSVIFDELCDVDRKRTRMKSSH